MAIKFLRVVLTATRLAVKKIFDITETEVVSNTLHRNSDLPSVEEFTAVHLDRMGRGQDIKGIFTSDPKTLDIAREVLESASLGKEETLKFFNNKIFSQPTQLISEKGSVVIRVSDIDDFPDYKKSLNARERQGPVMLCIGGPAAEDQTVLASLIPQVRRGLGEIIYLTRDYKESNANHAAKQSHARHGNALNADEKLTGHSLLPLILVRNLIGVPPQKAIKSDFVKIDVPFTIDPAKLRIYFGNELNWLKQVHLRRIGKITEHDIGRMESILSQEIISVLERETGVSLSGGVDRAKSDPSSIHVAFTERNARAVERENEEFRRVGISAKKLTYKEMDFFFGNASISAAWRYAGDTHLKFNIHELNREIATSNGVQWIEGEEVKRILLTKDENGNAKVVGVATKDNEVFAADKLHFTGGFKAQYVFDNLSDSRFLSSWSRNLVNRIEDLFNLQQPLRNDITVSTGVSINAVFKKSDQISRMIDRYGSTAEISVTNTHWTMIAQNDDYVVMRITGGGNTGSEEYNPAYFINVLANTRRIFGDNLVGVLSSYGCPRAINARNSTEFARIAEGAIVSYGKGGTGHTKRHSEAASGLMLLGFEPEVIEYFNKFQSRNGMPLGDELEKMQRHLEQVEFVHDNRQRTNRRMGYDNSFSFEETLAAGFIAAALSYALYRVAKKDEKEEKKEEEKKPIADSTIIKPKSATSLLVNLSQQRLN